MSWSTVLPFLIGAMYVLAMIFAGVNELLEGKDKDIIKSKVEDLWIVTAELSTAQKVGEALKLRRRRNLELIPRFIQLFWLLLLVVMVDTSIGIYSTDAKDTQKLVGSNLTFDYNFNSQKVYQSIIAGYELSPRG
jgi:hypothetical protein